MEYGLSSFGNPIPNRDNAVSVSLPSWKNVVAYEMGDPATVAAMKTGYPRFRIHDSVLKLHRILAERANCDGRHDLDVMCFPSEAVASRFHKFMVMLSMVIRYVVVIAFSEKWRSSRRFTRRERVWSCRECGVRSQLPH